MIRENSLKAKELMTQLILKAKTALESSKSNKTVTTGSPVMSQDRSKHKMLNVSMVAPLNAFLSRNTGVRLAVSY